jgi:predicted metal-dependent hydrolase
MKKLIKKLINEIREETGIEEKVTLRLIPMKRKIASISLKKKEIRINDRLLDKFDEDMLREIIAHELLHIKHGMYHTLNFEKDMKKFRKKTD